jgi:hypothetical protein
LAHVNTLLFLLNQTVNREDEELMARQVERRKALLVEAKYALDTDEVLLTMNFPYKEPLEVLITPDNAKRLAASLTRIFSDRV